MNKYVLSAVGPDSPGLVKMLSGFLAERGFNLEDSRMAVLGGDFALILLVTHEEFNEEEVQALIPGMESMTGLAVQIRTAVDKQPGKPGVTCRIHAFAIDSPGIVHALAHEIASLGANIEEMQTSSYPAPVTGTPLFRVHLVVTLPPAVSILDLRNQLTTAGEEKNIDILVEPGRD